MASFTITVDDKAVQASLQALSKRVQNMRPVLKALGETIITRTTRRFDTSTGPDGVKWKANSAATLAMLAGRLSGQKSKVKKDGSLNALGNRAMANKKPLIQDGNLRRQFTLSATSNSVTVGNTMRYAAMQQFGGTTGAGSWIPGKKIHARPFLPIRQNGTLYPADQTEILKSINAYLMDDL